jgi:hypothetical protein
VVTNSLGSIDLMKQILPVRPPVVGRLMIQISYLTVALVLYLAIRQVFAGNVLAILGAAGYYWMINTASVMTNSVAHSDYQVKSRVGQLIVGSLFLALSVLLMYIGNYDRITLGPNSTRPVDIFLWVAAPILGIAIGITGGGRTRRQ